MNLAPFDGNIDNAGPSGRKFGISGTQEFITGELTGDLSSFEGLGNITFSEDSDGNHSFSGSGGNWEHEILTYTSAEYVLVYIYEEPVPDITVDFTETSTGDVCDPTQTITRTWTAEDACGNEVSHTQTITIQNPNPLVADAGDDVTGFARVNRLPLPPLFPTAPAPTLFNGTMALAPETLIRYLLQLLPPIPSRSRMQMIVPLRML